jgi:hypothetical protein
MAVKFHLVEMPVPMVAVVYLIAVMVAEVLYLITEALYLIAVMMVQQLLRQHHRHLRLTLVFKVKCWLQ